MPERAIGVDVGGTAVKLGVVSADGEVLHEGGFAVGEGRGTGSFLDELARTIREAVGGHAADGLGLGLGVPGLLDRDAGAVLSSPNLPFLDGVLVRPELARRLGLPAEAVRLENDANVAALGEQWLGAARDERHVCVVTLGTGIGGGLILGGELFVGEGDAGEIGHVTVDPRGPLCGCGAHGCLETLASATAARRRALAAGLPADDPGNLELLAEVARESAGPERTLLADVGRDLGRGLATALCLLDVRAFVLGGGFAGALDVLEPGVREGLRERSYGERVGQVRIRRAELGASAGWIGAARLGLRP